MKKITIILVVVTVICHPLTATDVEKEYNQRRLSIEEKVGFFGSWGRFGGTVSSYQRWRYFQGFTEIKEPEFLDIAGYTDEVIQSKKHHQTNSTLSIISWSLLGISLAGIALGGIVLAQSSYSSDLGYGLLYGSMVIDIVALIPALALILRDENWLPLQQATSIAEEYNKKLWADLQE